MVDFNAGIRYISTVVSGRDKAALLADQLSVFAPKCRLLAPHCQGATLDHKMANPSTVTFDPCNFFGILRCDQAVVSLSGYPVTGSADGCEARRMLATVEVVGSHTDAQGIFNREAKGGLWRQSPTVWRDEVVTG